MSTRETRKRPPDQGTGQAEGSAGLVQQLLAERRGLMIANERLKLELDEARASDRGNPRVRELEAEVRRLRHELDAVREQRQGLEDGMLSVLEDLRRAGC
jgi:capsule polysaccharide export protein KpsE/RkpR